MNSEKTHENRCDKEDNRIETHSNQDVFVYKKISEKHTRKQECANNKQLKIHDNEIQDRNLNDVGKEVGPTLRDSRS